MRPIYARDSSSCLVMPWLRAEAGRREASGGEQQEDAACRQGAAGRAGRPQRTAPLAGLHTTVCPHTIASQSRVFTLVNRIQHGTDVLCHGMLCMRLRLSMSR